MIYSIVAYGDPVLRKEAKDITDRNFDIKKLVEDMYETMYNAHGVGLAAPQIGKGLRVFENPGNVGGAAFARCALRGLRGEQLIVTETSVDECVYKRRG